MHRHFSVAEVLHCTTVYMCSVCVTTVYMCSVCVSALLCECHCESIGLNVDLVCTYHGPIHESLLFHLYRHNSYMYRTKHVH